MNGHSATRLKYSARIAAATDFTRALGGMLVQVKRCAPAPRIAASVVIADPEDARRYSSASSSTAASRKRLKAT